MAAATTVKLVISSEVRLVDVVHSASETMAGLAGFDEDESLNVGLAVREAVINAIVHGNKRDPSRRVDVVLKARPRSITAQVRDQGSGFDLEAMNDPTAEANILNTSGRGILMMRAFVDDVGFKYREGRGTEVTLKVRKKGGRRKDNGGSER